MSLTLFVQLFGVVGIIMNIASLQFNKHQTIMLFKSIGCALFVIQQWFLSAFVGMVMDILGLIRNIVFAERIRRGKPMKACIAIFSVIIVMSGIFTASLSWNITFAKAARIFGNDYTTVLIVVLFFSALSITAKLLTTIAYGIDDAHKIRMMNIPSSSLWLIYNGFFFSLSGMLNEVLNLISVAVAEIRYNKKNTTSKRCLHNAMAK